MEEEEPSLALKARVSLSRGKDKDKCVSFKGKQDRTAVVINVIFKKTNRLRGSLPYLAH